MGEGGVYYTRKTLCYETEGEIFFVNFGETFVNRVAKIVR